MRARTSLVPLSTDQTTQATFATEIIKLLFYNAAVRFLKNSSNGWVEIFKNNHFGIFRAGVKLNLNLFQISVQSTHTNLGDYWISFFSILDVAPFFKMLIHLNVTPTVTFIQN
jgi:hypothetical protein